MGEGAHEVEIIAGWFAGGGDGGGCECSGGGEEEEEGKGDE